MSKLNSVDEAAGITGLSVTTLAKWRISGKGPQFVKMGKRVFYRDEDLQTFIAAGIRRSTSQEAA
jgi:predicted site-specific integrase-resolvase